MDYNSTINNISFSRKIKLMAYIDELRLMTKVARMYYEDNMWQTDIAEQLGLSQATISRLFNRAREEGIIRTTVNTPNGVFVDLERELVERYGLRDAIVIDCQKSEDEDIIHRDIGAAASYYVETAIKNEEIIGISSWSATLLALVNSMHPIRRKKGVHVVELLGSVGNPAAEIHATRLTGRFADLVHGQATYLPAPGVVGTKDTRDGLISDPYIRDAMVLFDRLTMALVGIGSITPSPILRESGNIFSDEELNRLREKKAVGDISLRFYDADGNPIESSLNDRLVSVELEQLKRVDRVIGMAGGIRKLPAIRGALRGGLINILITDYFTAERLLSE
jgi:DNA-binding transcriptional regulator LsrR (DeoR family)